MEDYIEECCDICEQPIPFDKKKGVLLADNPHGMTTCFACIQKGIKDGELSLDDIHTSTVVWLLCS